MTQAAANRRFNLELKKESADILGKEFQDFVKEVAVAAATGIVRRSAVLTGLSVGNWFAGPADSPAIFPDRKDPGKATTLSRLISDITVLAGTTDQIHIMNNQPYINKLEDGFSRKAPTGMVAVTVRAVESRFS